MTEQEQPQCPYCDEATSGKWGVIHGDGTPGDDVPVYEIYCKNMLCCAGCLIQQITQARSIRQANDLKLVDRKVREAVDAEREAIAVIVEGFEIEMSVPCGCYSEDILAKRIRARKASEKGKP